MNSLRASLSADFDRGISGAWDDVVSARGLFLERWTERLRQDQLQLERIAAGTRAPPGRDIGGGLNASGLVDCVR